MLGQINSNRFKIATVSDEDYFLNRTHLSDEVVGVGGKLAYILM